MGQIFSGKRRIAFSDLKIRASRAASGLASLGVGQGDLVALVMRNEPAFFEVSLAAGLLGAYATPFNWHSTLDEAQHLFADAKPRVVAVHSDLLPNIITAIGADTKVLVVPTPAELAEAYDIASDRCAPKAGMVDWSVWLEGFAPWSGPAVPSPGTIVYTSGTTGRPKGVRRFPPAPGQDEALRTMMSRLFGFTPFRDKPQSLTNLVCAPLYHSAPNVNALLAMGMGATTVMLPRFEPELFLRVIDDLKVTHAYMVPIMFNRLLGLPQEIRNRYDTSSLIAITHMGSPCPMPIKQAMLDWWGPIVNEGYGSTEARLVTTCLAEEWLARPGTVGRADESVTVKIVDEKGNELPLGVPGEIVSRAAGIADFTYHGDDAKRQALNFGDGLIGTGDVGYFDADGYLYLCDRSRDMIISGGVNIYPAEIESVLSGLEGVEDCAVFGIPDPEFGEAVCAVVQARRDFHLDAEAVKSYLKGKLSGFKVPRRIEFRAELPRSEAGKILKRKLREPYWQNEKRAI